MCQVGDPFMGLFLLRDVHFYRHIVAGDPLLIFYGGYACFFPVNLA